MKKLSLLLIVLVILSSCITRNNEKKNPITILIDFGKQHDTVYITDDVEMLDSSQVDILLSNKVIDSMLIGSIEQVFPTDNGFIFTGTTRQNNSAGYSNYMVGKLNPDFSLLNYKKFNIIPSQSAELVNHTLFSLTTDEEQSIIYEYDINLDTVYTYKYPNYYNEGSSKLLYSNNLLYIFTTNGYKLRLQSFDINSKKIITDNIPDSSGQMIDNVLIKKNKFYVISSSILNYNPVPTIFEFNEDQTIASKNMLIADSSFETRSALFINDSIMLLAGTKYYIGKWNSYSRPSILITTTRGRILKQIDCLYHEYVSNNTGEFIDIKLYKNHFLLLFQSDIDSHGKLLLAKLNSNTWKIDWLYELYRSSGRSCNSIYINEKDEIVVFGGEFEGNADIPQYDHPKLIKFKILE